MSMTVKHRGPWYHSAADTIRTEDAVVVAGSFTAAGNASFENNLSVSGTLTIGSDVVLTRSAADTLRTDDFVIFGYGSGAIWRFANANAKQTTVGAAGVASALPANPTGYLKIKGDDGSDFVIPFYDAA